MNYNSVIAFWTSFLQRPRRLILVLAFALTALNLCTTDSGWLSPASLCAIPDSTIHPRSAPESTAGNNPKFLLYRLIGNNMPPLQCPSQLLWNTEYALKHESSFPRCRKRWILNHIINDTERALVLDALIAHGYSLQDIIIRNMDLKKLSGRRRSLWVDLVTAQNEARNAAIEDGKKAGARWILPFDGNHFLTEESWKAIEKSADLAEKKGYKYFKVPVHRVYREQTPSWLNASSQFDDIRQFTPFMIESQLAFRNDAEERFQEGMVYGKRNKLETLERVCGSPRDPSYVERCQCADLGQEGQLHKSSAEIAMQCGYSLRLWFYPCPGTDANKVFQKGLYRKRMRTAGRKEIFNRIREAVVEASKKS